jgi:hypothetical protein
VLGQVDDPHPAAGDHRLEAVAAKLDADQRISLDRHRLDARVAADERL